MRHNAKGQSLIELAVMLAFFIVPLMLLIPYFSKLIEARHYNDMSARYVAFEKTVWLEQAPSKYQSSGSGSLAIKQTESIKSEVPTRLFSQLNMPINSRVSNDFHWDVNQHAYATFKFNQSKQVDSQGLLAAYNPNDDESQHQYFNVTSSNTEALGTATSLVDAFETVANAIALNVEINTKGYYQGNSSIQVSSHLLLENEVGRDEMSDEEGRETKRKNEFEYAMDSSLYVLADGWNVGGPRHNVNRVREMMRSDSINRIPFINDVRDFVSHIPIAKGLHSNSLKFGHVDVEQLPEIRYDNE